MTAGNGPATGQQSCLGYRRVHLVRHDEGAAHVAILDQALSVGQPQLRADLDGSGTAAVRYRNYAVDVPTGFPAPPSFSPHLLQS